VNQCRPFGGLFNFFSAFPALTRWANECRRFAAGIGGCATLFDPLPNTLLPESYFMRARKAELRFWLLQLRVLGFGLLQDGNIRVGVFPEREKIFVSRKRACAGGIGFGTL
jgi:hypothetical protein